MSFFSFSLFLLNKGPGLELNMGLPTNQHHSFTTEGGLNGNFRTMLSPRECSFQHSYQKPN